jgi:hypothetical protein
MLLQIWHGTGLLVQGLVTVTFPAEPYVMTACGAEGIQT